MWGFLSKITDIKGGVGFLLGFLIGLLATLLFVQTEYYPRLFPNAQTKNTPTNQVDSTSELTTKSLVDISGSWILTHTVEGSNNGDTDLELKFRMYLQQSKNGLNGSIVKFMHGNDSIPKKNRTTLHLKGEIIGYKSVVDYKEKEKPGIIKWTFNEESKKLEGRFSSELGVSRGKSIAKRCECSDF